MQLSSNLSENLAAFHTMFGQSADYYAKQVTVAGCPAAILLFDGMASLSSLWTLLLDAVDRADRFTGLPGSRRQADGRFLRTCSITPTCRPRAARCGRTRRRCSC